ncbi:hypothetical protein RhiirA5_422903 [Rhizophagus irregularis]|uniref:Uncharacterized protein n=1 Tax=Rhizophagus irregularis TaxID=588596 RepID=A0A2N0PAZ3_9GLOM|nr:hypothetical protein RhiirA5_422903 [Rhizophagus irregularis]PKC68452.1 hypothetical protein RhiirA1_507112 [Rhizophagus irregularis]CAB4477781.1 unnamed protein product [Rhizophagus irregularis]CAB5212405.1 unnamed protein product [Rhizophagus irregularis]
MRREQRPTKKDFEYIIRIFEVDGTDGETYVEYKWKKASSSAIITIKEAKKYGFEQQIDEYLKDKAIIKINKLNNVDREKLRDMPKYYCTIGYCYRKHNSSAGRDRHELYSHIKKIKKGKIRKAIEDDKKNEINKKVLKTIKK